MVRGTRTAFDWACRMRAYAKKVVSNTTSLSFIVWSEDGETVTYKGTSFTMDSFRDFVASQKTNCRAFCSSTLRKPRTRSYQRSRFTAFMTTTATARRGGTCLRIRATRSSSGMAAIDGCWIGFFRTTGYGTRCLPFQKESKFNGAKRPSTLTLLRSTRSLSGCFSSSM